MAAPAGSEIAPEGGSYDVRERSAILKTENNEAMPEYYVRTGSISISAQDKDAEPVQLWGLDVLEDTAVFQERISPSSNYASHKTRSSPTLPPMSAFSSVSAQTQPLVVGIVYGVEDRGVGSEYS